MPAAGRLTVRLVAACAGAMALWPAAQARALTLRPLAAHSDPSNGPAVVPFRDRVLPGAPAPLARAAISSHLYLAPDRRVVEVTLSSSFADTPGNRAAAQTYVDFLGGRLHGFELSLLHVFIGTEREINLLCGGEEGILACYSALSRRMFVPDRDPSNGGPFTRHYAITHEYGHHIAATRRNDPFSALSYGAKYWASYQHVCSYARRQQLFPGNQTNHYLQDPGEGFADTFAHLHYPDTPFQFSRLMAPTAGSFAAIRQDVIAPWRAPRRFVLRGVLGRVASRSYQLHVGLDGLLDFRLIGPPSTNYDVQLYLGGRLITSTRLGTSHDHLLYTFCRPVELDRLHPVARVVRRSGSGPFSLYGSYPG